MLGYRCYNHQTLQTTLIWFSFFAIAQSLEIFVARIDADDSGNHIYASIESALQYAQSNPTVDTISLQNFGPNASYHLATPGSGQTKIILSITTDITIQKLECSTSVSSACFTSSDLNPEIQILASECPSMTLNQTVTMMIKDVSFIAGGSSSSNCIQASFFSLPTETNPSNLGGLDLTAVSVTGIKEIYHNLVALGCQCGTTNDFALKMDTVTIKDSSFSRTLLETTRDDCPQLLSNCDFSNHVHIMNSRIEETSSVTLMVIKQTSLEIRNSFIIGNDLESSILSAALASNVVIAGTSLTGNEYNSKGFEFHEGSILTMSEQTRFENNVGAMLSLVSIEQSTMSMSDLTFRNNDNANASMITIEGMKQSQEASILGSTFDSNISTRYIVEVSNQAKLTLSSTTFTEATTIVFSDYSTIVFTSVTITRSATSRRASCIYAMNSQLSLTTTTLNSCHSNDSEAGGITTRDGSLTITNSNFNNSKGPVTSSILGFGGNLTIKSTTFTSSDATTADINSSNQVIKLTNVTTRNHKAGYAYKLYRGSVTMEDSTIQLKEFECPGSECGGVMLVECVRVEILGSKFERLVAENGAAVKILGYTVDGQQQQQSDGDGSFKADFLISDSYFDYNRSRMAGGSVYISDVNSLELDDCRWNFNSSTEFKGGAVYVAKVNKKLRVRSSNLIGNTAKYTGGAFRFDEADLEKVEFSGVCFKNNEAQGSPNVSSPPRYITLQTEVNPTSASGDEDSLYCPGDGSLQEIFYEPPKPVKDDEELVPLVKDHKSGSLLAPLNFVLVDQFGQIVQENTNYRMGIIKDPTTQILEVSGTTFSIPQKHTYSFPNITLTGISERPYILAVHLEDLDGNILNSIEEKKFKIALGYCDQGEVVDKLRCVECPQGQYSLSTDKSSAKCITCPNDEAFCYGGASLAPRAGYWRHTLDKADFYPCLRDFHCLAGDQSNPKGTCRQGHTGYLCAACEDEWVVYGRKCGKCPEPDSNLTSVMLVTSIGFILFCLMIYKIIQHAELPREVNSVLVKIIFNYLTVIVYSNYYGLMWMEEMQVAIMKTDEDFSGLSYDCFFQQFLDLFSSFFFFKLFMIASLPLGFILMGFIVFGVIKLINRCRKVDIPNSLLLEYLKASVWASFAIASTKIFQTLMETYGCVELGVPNEFWLIPDLSTECWSTNHHIWAWGVALPYLIFYTLVLGWIFKSLRDIQIRRDADACIQYVYFLRGYKKKYYFWEIIIMLKKVALAFFGILFYKYSLTIRVQSLSVIMGLSLVLQVKFAPFTEKILNDMERNSIILSYFIGLSGIFFITEQDKPGFRNFLIVCIIFLNIFYMLFFAMIFIKQSRKRKMRIKYQNTKWFAEATKHEQNSMKVTLARAKNALQRRATMRKGGHDKINGMHGSRNDSESHLVEDDSSFKYDDQSHREEPIAVLKARGGEHDSHTTDHTVANTRRDSDLFKLSEADNLQKIDERATTREKRLATPEISSMGTLTEGNLKKKKKNRRGRSREELTSITPIGELQAEKRANGNSSIETESKRASNLPKGIPGSNRPSQNNSMNPKRLVEGSHDDTLREWLDMVDRASPKGSDPKENKEREKFSAKKLPKLSKSTTPTK